MDGTEPLPITMRGEVFDDAEEPRCFVLVDGQTMGVVGDSSVQGLLSAQDDTIGEVDAQEKGVEEEDRELGIFGMKDKMGVSETVEVVHVEYGKTLEVMHIDTGKPVQVIHIEGGGKLDFTGGDGGESIKAVIPSSPQSLRTSKVHLSNPNTQTRRIITTSRPRSILSTLPPITQPIINTKTTLTPQYCHIPSVSTFTHKAQSIAPSIDSNIIISNTNEVLGSTTDGLDNAIIISWPSMEPQGNTNTIGTQTEPYEETQADAGPSLNLFFCTFHVDGSVETYCDLPARSSKRMSVRGRRQCGDANVKGRKYWNDKNGMYIEEENDDMQQCGVDKRQRVSRSGRLVKVKGSLFKVNSEVSDEDGKSDPDYEMQEEEEEEQAVWRRVFQRNPLHRKRGRKRKKRPPSPENSDEDFQHVGGGDKRIKEEIELKEEPEEKVDSEEVNEEVLKKKGYSLRTKRKLKKLSDMHYLQDQTVKKHSDKSRVFQCHECERSFPTFFKLRKHAKQEHSITNFSFPCEVCGITFTRPHNLERHKETRHGGGQKRFPCKHCDRRFSRQDVLATHISMVHFRRAGAPNGVLPHVGAHHCTSCDNYFSREQTLHLHRQGDFTCKECSVSFECRTALRTHMYKNHPTTCPQCGKVCTNKQQMYFHRQTHTPKFQCKYCDKGFMWRSHYEIHLSTHTGEKPVSCDICGKSFAHKAAIGKHKWQEHNENNKKFKCDQCGKGFVYRGKLDCHMRSHTGEKPFCCEVCNSTFTQRSNLTAHIKSVHGVVVKSISSDGTTHTELVKYKRPKRTHNPTVPPPPPSQTSTDVVTNPIPQEVELPPPPTDAPHIEIQEQVHMSESSLETEAAVYQIVYAYP